MKNGMTQYVTVYCQLQLLESRAQRERTMEQEGAISSWMKRRTKNEPRLALRLVVTAMIG